MKRFIQWACFIVASVFFLTWLVTIGSGLAWAAIFLGAGYFLYGKSKKNKETSMSDEKKITHADIYILNLTSSFGEVEWLTHICILI